MSALPMLDDFSTNYAGGSLFPSAPAYVYTGPILEPWQSGPFNTGGASDAVAAGNREAGPNLFNQTIGAAFNILATTAVGAASAMSERLIDSLSNRGGVADAAKYGTVNGQTQQPAGISGKSALMIGGVVAVGVVGLALLLRK